MTTKYYSAKETAKILRQELKNKFPQSKFSVRSSRSSVTISWVDGNSYNSVKEFCNQFEGKSFDGMQDLETSVSTMWNGEEVCFSNYISCYRHLSPEFAQKILVYCIARFSNDSVLDITAVKIDISDYDGYASFNCDKCQEEADHYHETCQLLIKVAHQTNAYDTLDWATESSVLKEKKLQEQKAWEQREANRQKFIDSLECPLPKLENPGIVINDRAYLLKGTQPIVRANPEDEDTWICDRWVYVFEDSKGQEVSFEEQEVELAFHPIVPLSISPVDMRYVGKLACFNKQPTLGDYKHLCNMAQDEVTEWGDTPWEFESCRIVERIELSTFDYDRFIDNLMLDYNWLKGKGGGGSDAALPDIPYWELKPQQQELWDKDSYMIAVAIVADNRETFLVDPEGYSYARYVVLVDQNINQKLEWELAIVTNNDKIVSLGDYKEAKEDQSIKLSQFNLEELYKHWVQALVDSNRPLEILNYHDWLTTFGQAALEKQYKQFVNRCLGEGLIDQILSFQDWQKLKLDR